MKKYWIIYGGISYAGMGPDTNYELFYGTEKEANDAAYELAGEHCDMYEGGNGIPYYTDDEDLIGTEDDEGIEYEDLQSREEILDYYIEPATPEKIESCGLEKDLIRLKKIHER